MSGSLVGISALFYLALMSVFYTAGLAGVALFRRFAANRVPQSLHKRVLLTALLFPPIAALLPTLAGVILRHLHGDAAGTALSHHSAVCALVFGQVQTWAGFGANSQRVSTLLSIGAWLLIGVGVSCAVRLAVATLRLETGIAPLLSPPSARLADSLKRVGNRLALPTPLTDRFFECALPPDRSSVMGLTRAKCVLSRDFVRAAPPEELDALVAHEAGHLRSGDVYAAFAASVLNGLFFFLRPVYLLGKWWREAAELAADDTAVKGTGNDPLAVASAILRVKSGSGSATLSAALLPFAGDGMSAEHRVERLLAQAERAAPVANEPPLQIALTWGATGLLALFGAGLLASPDTACAAHCALELLKNVL